MKNHPKLEELVLYGTRVTDQGLVHLESLDKLTVIFLYGPNVTDSGLVHLSKIKSLTRVDFCGVPQVSRDGKEKLELALPNCSINW